MMYVSMMHVSMMHTYWSMMHLFMMDEWCMNSQCIFMILDPDACVYDAYINEARSLTLVHVCMMHEYMMHISKILVPDVCMMHECMMHISMILIPDPVACMNVWCMYLWCGWNFVTNGQTDGWTRSWMDVQCMYVRCDACVYDTCLIWQLLPSDIHHMSYES